MQLPRGQRAIGNSYGGTENFSVVISNIVGSRNQGVTCTAVSGVDDGNAEYFSKTIRVPARSRATLTWTSTEFGYGATGFPSAISMSCNLPAGTALNEWYIHWDTIDRIN